MVRNEVEKSGKVSRFKVMKFGWNYILAIIAFALFGSASVRAENIMIGTLLDDSGSAADQTPYVNAMTVTQVPKPSALSLLAVGLGGLVLRLRWRSHLASCPDLVKRPSCSL